MRTEAQKERDKIVRRIRESRPGARERILAYARSRIPTEEQKQRSRKYHAQYYANPKNRDRILAYSRDYGARHAEKKRQVSREWHRDNPEKVKARYRRDKQYPSRVMAWAVRGRFWRTLKRCSAKKANKIFSLVGCTPSELVAHLERLFKPGMTWENYGLHGWHVDHKMPCKAFDLTKPEEQKKCFHYTNLQPLWAKENWTKSAKII